jgi:hypothetical protein
LRRRVLGIEFDEPQVLRDRPPGVALAPQHPGEFQTAARVVLVLFQDVAELDQRPVGLAGGHQLDAALEMVLRAFLRRIAGRDGQDGDEQGGGQETRFKQWHGMLRIGRFGPAAPSAPNAQVPAGNRTSNLEAPSAPVPQED